MSDKTDIRDSTVISGSNIVGSSITNSSSRQMNQMTQEMWEKVFALGENFGKSEQQADIRLLKESLDNGNRLAARAIWPRVESFLQNFANIAEAEAFADRSCRSLLSTPRRTERNDYVRRQDGVTPHLKFSFICGAPAATPFQARYIVRQMFSLRHIGS